MTPLEPDEARELPRPDLGTLEGARTFEVGDWCWQCEDCKFATRDDEAAGAHSDEFKHSLARCPVERAKSCPRCGSPDPQRHPAAQFEGEVQPCPDQWHGTDAKPTGRLLTPQEEANQRTKAKRRQRKRSKKRQERRIAELEFDLRRVLRAAASAMERCEVATDPSGAADEASDILAQVVTLSGELVCEHYGCRKARPNPPCKQVDTSPGGTWIYACGHLIGK